MSSGTGSWELPLSHPARFFDMILYTEKQLNESYDVYRRNQIKHNASFITKEHFITMFEELMEVVYEQNRI